MANDIQWATIIVSSLE